MFDIWYYLNYLTFGCFGTNNIFKMDSTKYVTIKLLNTGGFGQIFLVENENTKYAIKQIETNCPSDMIKVQKEIDIHLSLDHRNVLNLIKSSRDVSDGQNVGTFLMLMPYQENGSLQDDFDNRKKSNDFIKKDRIKTIFGGILDGVEYLHTRNPIIIHKDLKAANILLSQDDTPLIMDFGSAAEGIETVLDSIQSRRLLDECNECCSMPYRAPELFHCEIGTQIGEKVDIYSVGGILFALYHLRGPYDLEYETGGSYALASNSGVLKFGKDVPIPNQNYIKGLMAVNPVERLPIKVAKEHFTKLTFENV
uniref:Protein kinase domain-containing protein n=2 Tax=Rhabditophanes sp. KR3021 TaxID=114890 RepID=A0AC35U255_9BILA